MIGIRNWHRIVSLASIDSDFNDELFDKSQRIVAAAVMREFNFALDCFDFQHLSQCACNTKIPAKADVPPELKSLSEELLRILCRPRCDKGYLAAQVVIRAMEGQPTRNIIAALYVLKATPGEDQDFRDGVQYAIDEIR